MRFIWNIRKNWKVFNTSDCTCFYIFFFLNTINLSYVKSREIQAILLLSRNNLTVGEKINCQLRQRQGKYFYMFYSSHICFFQSHHLYL